MSKKKELLQKVLDNTVDNKKVFGTSFAIKKEDFLWVGASGDLATDDQYFIASTTKLFTTTLIMQLRSQKKLDLDDKISNYLDDQKCGKLHVYKNKDYTDQLTVRHLLAHTSGLPDYFQDKGSSGASLEDEIKAGKDQFWTFEEIMERSRSLSPHFAPDTKGKAHYSDVNFQLLGKMIENITDKSYAVNCVERIIQPVDLTKTYLYADPADRRPKLFYFKTNELSIPKAMTAFGPDGGMVSTSTDMLQFVEAFFTGKLFPMDYIDGMQHWNRIFFPFKSGVGIHLFKLPWIVNPTGAIPYFIGHSGLSGALAYHSPEKNLYIAGTANQVAHPDISFKMMVKLARQISNM